MTRRRARRPDRPTRPHLVPPLVPDELTPEERLTAAIASEHWSGSGLRDLADQVGGVEHLGNLDAEPLVPIPLDADRFDEPVRATVRSILDAFDGQPPWMIDAERRAILHRLIELLTGQPDVLCSSAPERTAAALAWLVERSLDPSRRPDLGWIWRMYRVPQSAPRAHALYSALGFATGEDGVRRRYLSDARLIPARRRANIISTRDAFLAAYDQHLAAVEAAKPVRHIGNGQVAARGHVIRPVWAAQGSVEGGGRRMVLVAVDHLTLLDGPRRDPLRAKDDVDEVISMSIPDAWVLLRQLQQALAWPATAPRGPRSAASHATLSVHVGGRCDRTLLDRAAGARRVLAAVVDRVRRWHA